MNETTLTRSELPLPLLRRGKVREIYEVGDDRLLMVTSDRISAFDVVMSEPIPRKGAVLTQLSAYWFEHLADTFPSHFITSDRDAILEAVPELEPHRNVVADRSMLVRRTEPIQYECVVRGYLSGSAWAEYSRSGTLAGEALPEGLVQSQQLIPPIFSPATKAQEGHDENITFEKMRAGLDGDLAEKLRDASLRIYEMGRELAAGRGIIIADTKFEFGTTADGELLLIDEVLTPDSSRFWPADEYEPGTSQPSFDKQPLRDYLADLKRAGKWDGEAPPPALPDEVVTATSERYRKAYQLITGHPLAALA